MNNRQKEMVSKGFWHGVYDHDHAKECDHSQEDFGTLYSEAYTRGFEAAKDRKWYFISIRSDGTKSYIVLNDNGNSWTANKEEATPFASEEAVRKFQMDWSCGRGQYSKIWA